MAVNNVRNKQPRTAGPGPGHRLNMPTEPPPSDLVELYVAQRLSLAVIGRRFGSYR
jgi:hypothetical protein